MNISSPSLLKLRLRLLDLTSLCSFPLTVKGVIFFSDLIFCFARVSLRRARPAGPGQHGGARPEQLQQRRGCHGGHHELAGDGREHGSIRGVGGFTLAFLEGAQTLGLALSHSWELGSSVNSDLPDTWTGLAQLNLQDLYQKSQHVRLEDRWTGSVQEVLWLRLACGYFVFAWKKVWLKIPWSLRWYSVFLSNTCASWIGVGDETFNSREIYLLCCP